MKNRLNMMVGPPCDKSRDKEAVEMFLKEAENHVVCGGITSRIVSLYLDKELQLEAEYFPDRLMSFGYIGDVIATEGVVTLNAIADYYEGEKAIPSEGSGARKILELFECADVVTVIFGTSVNEEHEGSLAFENKTKSLYTIKHKLEGLGKKVEIINF